MRIVKGRYHSTRLPVKYDAFISYRRSDGTRHAAALRRALLDFRFPRGFGDAPQRRLSVYLDTIYERATEDFFENTIKPALRESARLIVVRTPDALKPRGDGTPNWLEREIAYFRTLPQGRNVSVALANGEYGDPLPGALHHHFENVEVVDVRGLHRRLSAARTDAVLTFIATLHDLPPERMPELRAEEARRRAASLRRIAAGAGGVAVAMAGLAGWALVSRSRARTAEAEAVRQQRVAVARSLAAESSLLRLQEDSGIETSVLLAIESYRRMATIEGEQALRGAAALLVKNAVLREATSEAHAVSITADGATVAIAAREDREIALLRTGGGAPSKLTAPFPVWKVAFSPDGRSLAAASAGDIERVAVWSLDEPARARHVCDIPRTYTFKVANDGRTVALSSDGLRVLDCATGATILTVPDVSVNGIAFDDSDRWLAFTASDEVQVWSRDDWSRVAILPHNGTVMDVAFSADGAWLASGGRDEHTRLYDTDTWREHRRIAQQRSVNWVALDASGGRVVSMNAGVTRVWETATGRELARIGPVGDMTMAAAFAPAAGRLITADRDGRVDAWELATPPDEGLRLPLYGAYGPFLFRDDGSAAAVTDNGWIVVVDPKSTPVLTEGDQPWAVLRNDGSVVQPDLPERCRYVLAATATRLFCRESWGPYGSIDVVDAASYQLLRTIEGDIPRVVISRDGSTAAVLNQTTISVWTLPDVTQIATLEDVAEESSLALSSDGRHLAARDADQRAFLWTPSTNERRFIGPEEAAGTIAINDDASLAAISNGTLTRVIDLASGTELARLEPGSPAFDRTGTRLLIRSYEPDEVAIHKWRAEDVIARTCSLVSRNLTRAEWRRYVGSEPWRPTCDDVPISTLASAPR